jgi:MFS family permease
MATAAPPAREDSPAASSLLANPEFRPFLFTNGAWVFSWRALQVVIGFQVYELTKNPLDLGWLGLVEAVPGLTLVLYGGHYADRHDRRFTTIWGRGGLAVLSALLAVVSIYGESNALPFLFAVGKRPLPDVHQEAGTWQSIREGVAYVLSNQVLIGSMALDLFAVLFGGAVALLPVFASDILNVGAIGFGVLNAAPAIGALGVMLVALRYPPKRQAGYTLHAAVAGFGISMILFGLSENFLLSFLLLTISGAFDGLSVVTRRAISRLMVPHAMRGRVSAVSTVFIGSSNEIGAFESGVAASIFGTARSVWLGGVLTLIVVVMTALKAPKLLKLDLVQAASDPDL